MAGYYDYYRKTGQYPNYLLTSPQGDSIIRLAMAERIGYDDSLRGAKFVKTEFMGAKVECSVYINTLWQFVHLKDEPNYFRLIPRKKF